MTQDYASRDRESMRLFRSARIDASYGDFASRRVHLHRNNTHQEGTVQRVAVSSGSGSNLAKRTDGPADARAHGRGDGAVERRMGGQQDWRTHDATRHVTMGYEMPRSGIAW